MTLKQWFNESPKNKYAIRWAKNGRKYIYERTTKNANALNYEVEQVEEEKDYNYCWLYY